MAPKKRPSSVKLEPQSPKKQKTQPEKATLKLEKASPKKNAKTAEATAEEPAKAKGKKDFEAPSRDAWRDMRNQLISLEKAKKGPHLMEAWKGKKTQAEKRQFYYEVFLLDPLVSQKSVHKEACQRNYSLQRQVEGWMTKVEIGKLEGADPCMPNFLELCDAAVQGLPERDHEVKAWALKGLKQYQYSKKLHQENNVEDSSLVKAEQSVQGLEQDAFQKVEDSLKMVPTMMPVTIGGKPAKALGDQPKPQPEKADAWEHYKKCASLLKKAINSFCTQVNKVTTLKKSLEEASTEQKQDPQYTASMQALMGLEAEVGPAKDKWLGVQAQFPASLDKATEDEVTKKSKEAAEHKEVCDADLKSLNKALAPTRLWVKNTGLLDS